MPGFRAATGLAAGALSVPILRFALVRFALVLGFALVGPAQAGSYAVSEVNVFASRSVCVDAGRLALGTVAPGEGAVTLLDGRILFAGGVGREQLDALFVCSPTMGGYRGYVVVLSEGEAAGALREEIVNALPN